MNTSTSTNLLTKLSSAEMQLIQAFRAMDGEYARMWFNTGMSLSAKYPKEERPRFEIIRGGQS